MCKLSKHGRGYPLDQLLYSIRVPPFAQLTNSRLLTTAVVVWSAACYNLLIICIYECKNYLPVWVLIIRRFSYLANVRVAYISTQIESAVG